MQVQVVTCAFFSTGYRSEDSMTPSLGSANLLEQLAEHRNPVYLLYYQFISKDIKGYRINSQMKRYHRVKSQIKEHLFSWNLGPAMVACRSILVHQPGNSLNPSFWVFMDSFLHNLDWLNPWPMAVDSTSGSSPPSTSQRAGSGNESSNPLNAKLAPQATRLHP